jgi:WD40 repeat protein
MGRRVRVFKEHAGIVNAVASPKYGSWILTACDDGKLRRLDLRTRTVASTWDLTHPLTAVSTTPCGQQIFTGGISSALHLIDLDHLSHTQPHSDTITGLACFPDGRRVASASLD